MATIRKRSWTAGGETKSAWIATYGDQEGVRRQKTFPTRKAADTFLVRVRGEVAEGRHTPESTSATVAEACARWLRHCQAEELERATLRTYRLTAERHVLPMLGRERLAKLTAPRIQAYRDALLTGERPLSRQLAGKALWTVKAILGHAQKAGMVAQNVALPVKLGRSKRHKERVTVPTREHVNAMIAAAAPRWRVLIMTAAYTGLRASELRALTWQNVDLKAGTITVSQRADRWGTIGSPKSASSRRTVPLMPDLWAALREHQIASKPGAELVFATERGGVLAHSNMAERAFGNAQRLAGLVDQDGRPVYTVHALRHFAASMFIATGWPPKRVQQLLGHATLGMTLDTYTHLWPTPEDDRDRLAAAQRWLEGG